jgi:hypothetical protein
MPITSKQQQRLMYAALCAMGLSLAGSKKVAKQTGVPQKVAKEMIEATPAKAYKKMPKRAK